MRGRLAWSSARAARSMSPGWQRASAATVTPEYSRATLPTASKSPSEAMGKPASSTSTPRSTSCRAICIFSATLMLQPQDCSPSRRVVSKMDTRSLMAGDASSSRVKRELNESHRIWRIYYVSRYHDVCLCYKLHLSLGRSCRVPARLMDLHVLQMFRAVATEKSFSRAAVKLARTQPAVSLAVQRLEADVGEPLIDRSGKELRLTDAGGLVLDYARRFDNLRDELGVALAELRDNAAGRLSIGANESTTLYLLPHLARYRRRYPRVKLQVGRSPPNRIPADGPRGRP